MQAHNATVIFGVLLFMILAALWSRGRLDHWIAEDRPKPAKARTVRGVGFLLASGVAALSAVAAALTFGTDNRSLNGTGYAIGAIGGVAFILLQARGSAAFLAQAMEIRGRSERPQ